MGVCVVGGSDRTAGEVRKEKQRESNGRDVKCRNGIEIVQSCDILSLFFFFYTFKKFSQLSNASRCRKNLMIYVACDQIEKESSDRNIPRFF